MRTPRVNIVKMLDLHTLAAHLDATDWQRRSVKGELPLVRIGLTCPVPVVATEELVGRRRWIRRF
jgi:hypothetical protein